MPGDPCYLRFREAVAAGAVPFCCQGPDNGLTIEGGATLAWEMVDALGGGPLDRLFVQVGGGALASACALGFTDAVAPRPPRARAAPPRRADRGRLPARARLRPRPGARARAAAGRARRRAPTRRGAPRPPSSCAPALRRDGWCARELGYAATHRSEFMWPWEVEPKSVATGILDDETYDWLAVVEAMLVTGGWPVVVDEATVARAHALGREATGIDVDPTGTAGLAGLIEALAGGLRLRRRDGSRSCSPALAAADSRRDLAGVARAVPRSGRHRRNRCQGTRRRPVDLALDRSYSADNSTASQVEEEVLWRTRPGSGHG